MSKPVTDRVLTPGPFGDEDEMLRNRMAGLLTRTANALKGEPEPLHLHDWSDLPERAGLIVANEARLIHECERLRAERDLLRAEVVSLRKIASVGRAAVAGRPVTGMLTLDNERDVDAVVEARAAVDAFDKEGR
jgi:hypothetical protein